MTSFHSQLTSLPGARSPKPVGDSHELSAPALEPVSLIDDKRGWSYAGATCRRVLLLCGDVGAVVFISDSEASGRSISNVMEEIAGDTARDFFVACANGAEVRPAQIRYFEHRTGERTADDVPQSLCFEEFRPGESPLFIPARDEFAARIAGVLSVNLAACDAAV